MAVPSVVYEWLELWEQIRDAGRPLSPEEFARVHLRGAPRDHVSEFVTLAQALLAVNQDLQRFGSATAPGNGDTGSTDEDEFAPGGEPLPGYRLARRLGRGGFGAVWKGAGPDGRPVAIKIIPRAAGTGELRAVEYLCDARHPNLIEYRGAHETARHLIIVMELADRTVADRLEEVRRGGGTCIPRNELMGYMTAAAAGLDFLNSGGEGRPPVQHRDVKPQNLLLIGDTLKLGDFGLVRKVDHSATGHTGQHTLAYAPPEFMENQATPWSDQYSLAVAYCQLRGGRLPFTGTDMQVIRAHVQDEPDLSMLPTKEEQLVVRRALAKTPKHRWKSCGAFVAALRAGAKPAEVRNELCRDARNVTLRRLYLAIRTAGQARADQLPWDYLNLSCWVLLSRSPILFIICCAPMVLGAIYVPLKPEQEWSRKWFIALAALFTLWVAFTTLRHFIKHARRFARLRWLAAEIGPLPDFPPAATPTEIRASLLGADRDLSDVSGSDVVFGYAP
jgi:hypothetical protein